MNAPNLFAEVPAGRWIVGVSGGVDSVALVRLVCLHAKHVKPIVAHFDHELRGDESAGDSEFVRELSQQLGLPFVVARRSELDSSSISKNVAGRLRSMRLRFFSQTTRAHAARGVLLAHHADDVAETTLLRLLRGGEPTALAGLRSMSKVNGVEIRRPLLSIRKSHLESFLNELGQGWREDSSNAKQTSKRNRVRKFLCDRPTLIEQLLAVSRAAGELRKRLDSIPPPAMRPRDLLGRATIVQRRSARAFLKQAGVPGDSLSIELAERLVAQACDFASPRSRTFPGGVQIERTRDGLRVV